MKEFKIGDRLVGENNPVYIIAEAGCNHDGKLEQGFRLIEEAAKNADVIMAVIEWPEIVSFDYGTIKVVGKNQYFIDGRNQFDPDGVKQWGYQYLGIGRRT